MRYKLQVFFMLLLAPFLGMGLAGAQWPPFPWNEMESLVLQDETWRAEADQISGQLLAFKESLRELCSTAGNSQQLISMIRQDAHRELLAYEQQHDRLQDLVKASAEQQRASGDMIELVLANMLGDPVGQTFGENATIKVYSLAEAGYRGYMAKVKLHNLQALKMVLAGDTVKSKGETTSAAAKRTGAALAINAGGFFAHEGHLVPLGATVIDGEIVDFSNIEDLSFVGFNRSGQLIGGRIETKEQIMAMDILHGASFLPTLLQGGQKQAIPAAWAHTRQPRTLIGHFDNGDLLFIVIDGRRQGWSNGVTLEEAQEKLLAFKVRDAYNLDGGGSSTFYYDGKVLNRPSDGVERRVVTNLVVLP